MPDAKYTAFPQSGNGIVEDTKCSDGRSKRDRNGNWRLNTPYMFVGGSVCLNIVLLLWLSAWNLSSPDTSPKCKAETQHKARTEYAGLADSAVQAWTFRSEYYSHNRTQSDAHWDAIDFNAGMIALTDEESKQMGLPKAERFPWDDSKGLYLVNAYHNLHCLKWLWKSLARWREGHAFGHEDWHNFHCVDSLRQDTLCNADDTPRYAGGDQPGATTGTGQERKCKSWYQLASWAESKTACYRYLNDSVGDTLERYVFCPEGSPYNERINRFFGSDARTALIERYGDTAA